MPDHPRDFAARLAAAMGLKGVGVVELGKRTGLGRNTVGRHLKPGPTARTPSATQRRKYERALGLPALTLDGGALRGTLASIAAGDDPAEPAVQRAAAFVLAQLQVYQRAGLPVPPQIVVVLAAELEAAMGAGPDGGAAGDAAPESAAQAAR